MLIEKMLKRSTAYILIILLTALAGLLMYGHLGVDILPNLNYPLINIVTHYPGASPQDVELMVTNPLESSLGGIKNLRRVSSVSSQGFSKVTCEFVWGTDAVSAAQQVNAAIARVRNALPPGTDPVTENIGSTLQEVIDYALFVKDKSISLSELRSIAEYNIAPALRGISGVSRVSVLGGEKEAFVVEPSIYSAAEHQISLSTIAERIQHAKAYGYAGFLTRYYQDMPVRTDNPLISRQRIGDISLKYMPPKKSVLLKDVSEIRRGTLPKHYEVYVNGQKGVVISVFKQPGANSIAVAKNIAAKIGEIKKTMLNSSNITIKNYYNQAGLISDLSGDLYNSILLGAILAVFILILLLSDIKGGLLIALTIPLSVLITFIFMHLFHLSLNVMTLGAFAVAMGMIIDDSVIVFENIYRHRQLGESAHVAAVSGLREIIGPDASGTFTSVAVFVPLLLLSGLAGRLFKPFGIVLSVTLLASLLCSVVLIPLVMAKRKVVHGHAKSAGTAFFSFIIKINRKILHFNFRYKAVPIILSVLFLALSVFLFLKKASIGMLPNIDEGAILCEYVMPPGVSLTESKKIGREIEHIIGADTDVVLTYLRVGSAENTYQVEGTNRGEILARLTSRKSRDRNIFDIMSSMKKATARIPGVILLFHLPTMEKIDESFSGLNTFFAVTVFGRDNNLLSKYAAQIEGLVGQCPYIGNVVNNSIIKTPKISISFDARKMNLLGISSADVYRELRYAIGGEIVTYSYVKGRQIPVFLRAKERAANLEQLRNMPLKLPSGAYVSLSDVASLKKKFSVNTIGHTDFNREVTMITEIGATPKKVINWMNAAISKLHLPKGYYVEYTGEYKSMLASAKSLVFSIFFALILISLIMLFQFNNLRQPFVILIELLFIIGAAFISLVIAKVPFNISAMIGMLTLIGVAVNNGIVYIDYANRAVAAGESPMDALLTAMSVRLRPIFLTTLTTVFGLLPIALSKNAQFNRPIAVVMIGGLLFSAIFTLTVLPVLLLIFEQKQPTKR